jgi:hypothetical protein
MRRYEQDMHSTSPEQGQVMRSYEHGHDGECLDCLTTISFSRNTPLHEVRKQLLLNLRLTEHMF